MKKVLMTILMIFTMVISTAANAATRATLVTPSLNFTGTTAYCRVSITEIGKNIDANLELWNGETLVGSWSGTAASYLVITGNRSVISGQTYTLEVTGTMDGISFTGVPVTKTC